MFSETLTWSVVEGEGNRPSARDKLQGTVIDTRIYYFGGFGPKLTGGEDDWEDVSTGTPAYNCALCFQRTDIIIEFNQTRTLYYIVHNNDSA